MQLSDIISIIAAVIAGGSLIYNVILNRSQNQYIKTQHELNEFLVNKEKKELEQEKIADLSANANRISKGKYQITVFNKGKVKADDVNFNLDSNDDWFLINENIFPLEYLDAGKSVNIRFELFDFNINKKKCAISWTDSRGKQEKEVILTI